MAHSSNPQEPEAPRTPILGPGPTVYSNTDADLESLRTRRREVRRKQLKILALLVVLIAAGAVANQIIRRTFLNVRTPKFRLGAVEVRNSTTGSTSAPSFRIRLEAQMTIKNTNFGRFEYYYSGYGNLTVGFYYRGAKVGEGVIGEGTAGARGTKRFNVSVALSSGGNMGSDLRNDISSGSVVLSGRGKLSGNVQVMWIVRESTEPELSCTMTVKLDSRTVQDLVCL